MFENKIISLSPGQPTIINFYVIIFEIESER